MVKLGPLKYASWTRYNLSCIIHYDINTLNSLFYNITCQNWKWQYIFITSKINGVQTTNPPSKCLIFLKNKIGTQANLSAIVNRWVWKLSESSFSKVYWLILTYRKCCHHHYSYINTAVGKSLHLYTNLA